MFRRSDVPKISDAERRLVAIFSADVGCGGGRHRISGAAYDQVRKVLPLTFISVSADTLFDDDGGC